jgi:hypothetical protein
MVSWSCIVMFFWQVLFVAILSHVGWQFQHDNGEICGVENVNIQGLTHVLILGC